MIPKNFKYGSSYSRDFITLTALVVAVAIISGILLAHEAYKSYKSDITTNLKSEAIRIDRKLILEMENAIYLTESIGRQIGAGRLSKRQILRVFNSFVSNGRKDEFFWVDARDDIAIGSNSGILDEKIDASDRRYLRYTKRKPWQVFIDEPIKGKITGNLRIPTTMGITDNDGNYMGTLLLSKDLSHLQEGIEAAKANTKVKFLVLDQKLDLLIGDYKSFNKKDISSLKKLSSIDYRQVEENDLIKTGLIDVISDGALYSIFEYSKKYPYIILLSFSETRGDFLSNSGVIIKFLQVVTITLVILIILLQVRQRVLVPVGFLNEITRDIVRGKRYTPKDHSGPKEVEELAKNLNILQEKMIIEEQNKRKINVLMDKFELDLDDSGEK